MFILLALFTYFVLWNSLREQMVSHGICKIDIFNSWSFSFLDARRTIGHFNELKKEWPSCLDRNRTKPVAKFYFIFDSKEKFWNLYFFTFYDASILTLLIPLSKFLLHVWYKMSFIIRLSCALMANQFFVQLQEMISSLLSSCTEFLFKSHCFMGSIFVFFSITHFAASCFLN